MSSFSVPLLKSFSIYHFLYICTSKFNYCFPLKNYLVEVVLISYQNWYTFLYSYLVLVQEHIELKNVKNGKHDSTVGSHLGEVNKAFPILDDLTLPPPPALGEQFFEPSI